MQEKCSFLYFYVLLVINFCYNTSFLLCQVVMHNEEVGQLLREVEQLEKNNLEIMSELFECQVEDLKISRSGHS